MIKVLVTLLFLVGCTTIKVPADFVYKEVETRDFILASWQKVTNPAAPYKIYIEGDGYAFNARGKATQDPTPRGTLVRELAFGDKRHWTTARFAPEVINAEYEAIKNIVGNNPVILVGFSGGAQIAGLAATAKPGLNVKKIITIAGNLDHLAWTQYHNLPPLNESMNLENYRKQFAKIPQIHYVGSKDEVTPPILAREFVGKDDLIIEVSGASHNEGWGKIYNKVWSER